MANTDSLRVAADDAVEVRHILLAFWRRRLIIVLSTLIFGGLGWAANSLTPRQFKADARAYAGDTLGATVPAEAMAKYQVLVSEPELVLTVLKQLALDGPPHNLTAGQLGSAITTAVGTPPNVLIVSVTLAEPQQAATAATAIVQRAVAIAPERNRAALSVLVAELKTEFAEAEPPLREARRALAAFRLANAQADPALLASQKQDLLSIPSEIELERVRLLANERQLARTPLTLSFDGPPVEPGQAALRTILNPTHSVLAEQVALSRTNLEVLETKRAYLLQVVRRASAPATGQSRLPYPGEYEDEESQLEDRVTRLRSLRNEIRGRLERAVPENMPGLHKIEEAVAPGQPVGASPMVKVVLGLATGLALSLIGVVVMDIVNKGSGANG